MEYGFLTMLIPKSMEDKVYCCSRRNMQDAANILQHHIYKGLTNNLNKKIKMFNVLPIGSFPQFYSESIIKEEKYVCEFGFEHINIGFCNVKFLRKINQVSKIYRVLNEWCKNEKDEKTLFVYTLSAPFLKAVEKVKIKYENLHVCAIVADLPNMSSLSSKKGIFENLFARSQAQTSFSRLNCIDSFVLLTEQMADYLNIKDKPYCVMEGISTDIANYEGSEIENDEIKKIFYSGTLHKKFGVLNLLETFKKIDNCNYRLQLCGVGDCEEIIKNECKKDSRIEFFGQLKREEVLKLQKQATILVNPRQNNEEFTKYSFPSKILEYLSSGTPVVAYKLDGIPDDYDDYIYYVEGNEIEDLRKKIVLICEQESSERKLFAIKAQDYVQKNKNSIVQTKKIIDMLMRKGK